MKKIVKRIILVFVIVLVIVTGIAVYNFYPMLVMKPAQTGNIPGTNIFAAKNNMNAVFFVDTGDGYIMISSLTINNVNYIDMERPRSCSSSCQTGSVPAISISSISADSKAVYSGSCTGSAACCRACSRCSASRSFCRSAWAGSRQNAPGTRD